MALKGLVNKIQGKIQDKLAHTLLSKSDRGPWLPDAGPYPLLSNMMDEDLQNLSEKNGVFVMWHRGVRPQWIFAGFSPDLAVALIDTRADEDIQKYMLNEGVYAAWAFLPEAECHGVVKHLRTHLQPALTTGHLVEMCPLPADTEPTDFPLPID